MKMTCRIFARAAAILLLAAVPLAGPVTDLLAAPVADNSFAFMEEPNNLNACYNADADEYLVVYSTEYNGGPVLSRVYAQRVDAESGVPAGPALVIDQGGAGAVAEPAVAYAPGSGRYLFVQSSGSKVIGRLIEQSAGTLSILGAQIELAGPVPNGTYLYQPSVAFGGGRFLVAWAGWTDPEASIQARAVGISGAVEGSVMTLAAADTSDLERPVVAHLGGAADSFLVAYEESSGSLLNYSIKARTIDSTLTMGTPQEVSSASGPASNNWVRIAANEAEQEWMLAWEKTDNETWYPRAGRDGNKAPLTEGDIAFRRVDASGQPKGPEVILPAGPLDLDFAPAIAWNALGNEYVIHWQREPFGGAQTPSILGARIIGPGSVPTVNGELIATDALHSDLAPVLVDRRGTEEQLSAWGQRQAGNPAITFQAIRVATSQAPLLPAPSLLQRNLDGSALATGETATGHGFVAGAFLDDPEGEDLRLQVEVKPLGVAFDGTGLQSSATAVPAGSPVELIIPGLAPDVAYHWRARALDPHNAPSTWAEPGGSPDFVTPLSLPPLATPVTMHRGLAASPMLPGDALVGENRILFRAIMDDPDAGQTVRLEVEVRPLGEAFRDIGTGSSPLVAVGTVATAHVLAPLGSHHVQTRAVDQYGKASAWTPFGGNAESDADFAILDNGSAGNGSCLGSGGGAASPAVIALLSLALLAPRLRRQCS